MDLKIDWWLSLALAIPIGIAANLLTPKISAALERRTEEGKQRQAKEEERWKRRITRYATDLPALYLYLLGVGIRISLLSAAQSIVNGMFSVLPNALSLLIHEVNPSKAFQIAAIFDSGVRLLIALGVFSLCKHAILTLRGVQDFRKRANKALEPTPTAVTDRAAHAPRQP